MKQPRSKPRKVASKSGKTFGTRAAAAAAPDRLETPAKPRLEEFTVADFADWVQDGIHIWLHAASPAEADRAFIPARASNRTSLVMAIVGLSEGMTCRARTRFHNGLVFAAANWTGNRPIAVLQALIEVCTELRPASMIDHLHRFIASSMLSGESKVDRERTIDLVVTMAAGYPLDDRIGLFFEELRANGLWRPGMAARKMLAQTLARQSGWLDFVKASSDDLRILQQTGRFELAEIFKVVIATAGMPSVGRAIESVTGSSDDAWILDQFRAAIPPVLKRVRRGDGEYLVSGREEIAFDRPQPGELTREDRVTRFERKRFLDQHLPSQPDLPKERGGELLRMRDYGHIRERLAQEAV